MKRFATLIFAGVAAVALAGCSTTERGAGLGAAAGAVVGGVSTGTMMGAAVGAGVGAAGGALLGHLAGSSSTCIYEYPDGSRYTTRCPDNVRWN